MWKISVSYLVCVTISCRQGKELVLLAAEKILSTLFCKCFSYRNEFLQMKMSLSCILRKHHQSKLKINYFVKDANISYLLQNSLFIQN